MSQRSRSAAIVLASLLALWLLAGLAGPDALLRLVVAVLACAALIAANDRLGLLRVPEGSYAGDALRLAGLVVFTVVLDWVIGGDVDHRTLGLCGAMIAGGLPIALARRARATR